MNISANTKPALWGAAGGAVALAMLGFNWGGWVTGPTAARSADRQEKAAVTKVLAPICVFQFNDQPTAGANLMALREIESVNEKASYIEKSGAATMPGSAKMEKGVSEACAELLAKTN